MFGDLDHTLPKRWDWIKLYQRAQLDIVYSGWRADYDIRHVG
jgi:hypothetical protein